MEKTGKIHMNIYIGKFSLFREKMAIRTKDGVQIGGDTRSFGSNVGSTYDITPAVIRQAALVKKKQQKKKIGVFFSFFSRRFSVIVGRRADSPASHFYVRSILRRLRRPFEASDLSSWRISCPSRRSLDQQLLRQGECFKPDITVKALESINTDCCLIGKICFCRFAILVDVRRISGITQLKKEAIPLRTAAPFWGQTTQNSSASSPKRDCSSKGLSPALGIF